MIGKRIKQLRIENKLTQQELGEKVGVSQRSIAFYEKEEKEPAYDILIKIANYFGVTTDFIFGITNNKDEVISKPDEYDILIGNAKEANVPADALRDYIEVLKKHMHKKN